MPPPQVEKIGTDDVRHGHLRSSWLFAFDRCSRSTVRIRRPIAATSRVESSAAAGDTLENRARIHVPRVAVGSDGATADPARQSRMNADGVVPKADLNARVMCA